MTKETIVITGGSGCLAQHLIRELQQNWVEKAKEIRVVDKKIFKKFLDYEERIPVVEYIADCSNENEILPAFAGATLVFHMAARPFSYDMYPNNKGLWQDNYIGTETVLATVIKCNIEHLIYTSDAYAWMETDAQGATELNRERKPPKSFLLGTYGKSKYFAERLVRNANGKSLDNGKSLKTTALCPFVIYGQGDQTFFPYVLRICKQYGYIQTIGDIKPIFPYVYAGNAAVAHVCAAEKLLKNPSEIGGEMFFIGEDVTPMCFYDFIKPVLEKFGYKSSSWSIYWMLGYAGTWMMEKFFGLFYNLFGLKFPHNLPNTAVVLAVAGYYFTFWTTKSRLVLDYKPKYQYPETVEITSEWFMNNKDSIGE